MHYAIPPILQLEPATACNLGCPFCLRSRFSGSDEYLSFEDFQKITDAAKCRYLTLHGWGEPLLHPELPAMIRYAASKKISVNFTTNATLLPARTTEILNSGLDAIAFSFPETRQFTPLVTDNVAAFLRERSARGQKGPKAYLNIALMDDQPDSAGEGIRLAAGVGLDVVNFERSFPWSADQAAREKALFARIAAMGREAGCTVKLPPAHTNPCPLVRLTMFVRTNGDVAPCCYRADTSLGNILRDGLLQVIRNRAQFMKTMQADPVCRACRV